MKLLASIELLIFLTCWLVYSLFFATNVVREHYPAFSLIERGDFVCDAYYGFHADIFRHSDGHAYVGNNVLGSVIAAVPLVVFDPALDALERHSKRKLREQGPEAIDTTYDTKYPLRREMFRKVKLAGLDLRFGASTAITSILLIAPLSALMAVLVYRVLAGRGLGRRRAVWLALLFAFGTPVFYRTAHLNHNMFLMEALFGAFLLLWPRSGEVRLSTARRAGGGFLCGVAIALDYAGAVPAAVLGLYLVATRMPTGGLKAALRESVAFALAALPPVAFLLWSQWAMYGDPFTPGQFVMPAQNVFTDVGLHGMGLPSPEVFLKNLVSPSFGLLTFGPLLAFGLIPARRYPRAALLFPCRERRWSLVFVLTFMLFCAANWYSLLQFNTGFRYLLPVVPFLFLAASDHLARMPARWLALVTVLAVGHTTVLSMTREVNDTELELRQAARELGVPETRVPGYWNRLLTETPVPMSYRRIASEGPQLPWLTVLRQTSPGREALLGNPWLPVALIALCGLAVLGLWRSGPRIPESSPGPLPSGTGRSLTKLP
jgi:hypothetical protein